MTGDTAFGSARHGAAVLIGFVLLFTWLFARPLLEGTYLSETDLYDYYLPVFLAPPLAWSSFELAGMPAFADPENATFYPLHLLFARVIGSWTAFIMSAYVLAACFMYAYVFHHTRSARASALAGLAYALSEAALERMAHPTIVHVLAWLPLVLLSLDRVRDDRRRWTWAAIGAVAAGNLLLAGHPQVPVYVMYLCGAYVLANAFVEGWRLRWLAAVAALVSGAAMLSAIVWLPLAEATGYMARQAVSFEDFVSYSNTPAEMLSMFFPSIAHIGREAPTYAGLAVLMLAPLGVGFGRNWRAVFWLVVAAVALLLGIGAATPLADQAYSLPLYDSFRIVARHLVFATFALVVLAAFGAAAIEQGRPPRRAVVASIAAVLAIMMAAGVVLATRPEEFRYDSVNEALRLPFWNSGVWLQFAIAVVAGVACLGMSWRPQSVAWAVVLLTLVSGDLLHAFPARLGPRGLDLETIPAGALRPSVHAIRLKHSLDREQQRLFVPAGAQFNDIVPSMFSRLWRIPSAGGNSSVVIDRIAALSMLAQLRSGDPSVLTDRNRALDLLAVKYVIFREPLMLPGASSLLAGSERWTLRDRVFTSRVTDRSEDDTSAGEAAYVVYENRRALPRAWLAREVIPLTDGGVIDAIFGSRLRNGLVFDPAQTALVEEGELPPREYPDGQRDVRVESVHDGAIRIRVTSEHGGFLVLSEAHYPGWQARIEDGPVLAVHRADMALQGAHVPAGDHVVVFEFRSTTRRLGAGASLLGVTLVGGMFMAGRTRAKRGT